MTRHLRTLSVCALLVGSLSVLPKAACSQTSNPLTLYTEDLPPYNMIENGQVTGISSEIITTALSRQQIGFTVRLVAWPRAYHEALTDPNSCVYSTVRSADREALFQWIGPIGRDSLSVFVLPDSPIEARTLADLKGYRTVSTPGDYSEPRLRESGVKIVPAPLESDRQLTMLSAGRIDFWTANRSRAQIDAKRTGIRLRELFSYDDFELYLACNRAVAPELISRADTAIKQLWASGEAARITAKFTHVPKD